MSTLAWRTQDDLPVHSLRSRIVARIALGLVLLQLAGSAHAALVTLIAPSSPLARGGTARVELVVFNSESQAVAYALPTEFDGRLVRDGQIWLVTLQGAKGDISVPAGGFVRLPLVFALPLEATGQLVLEISQPARARAVLEIGTAEGAAAGPAGGEAMGAVPALPAASRLKRYYADHFSGHEPMYFVFGGDKPAAKFQLSLKYRILNDDGPLARRLPALRGLHVAYTQRSLWDITSDSSPFYDSSYMPEVLYESLAADTGKHRGFHWLGYSVGVQHESNGRAGAVSRSLNIVSFRPTFAFGDLDGWRLILRPKFFGYLGSSSENGDIKKYRGYSELRAIFGKNNRLSVSVTGRVGEDFDKGSAQFDVSYPTEFLTGNFATYLLVQYWTGYGESLLNYDKRSSTVRFGFALSR